MTYEQMYAYANSMNDNDFVNRLYHCTAWFTGGTDPSYVWLKSYNTVVAVFIRNEKKVIRFGKYSNTTYQHFRKFRNKMWEMYCNARECTPRDIEEIQLEFANWYK